MEDLLIELGNMYESTIDCIIHYSQGECSIITVSVENIMQLFPHIFITIDGEKKRCVWKEGSYDIIQKQYFLKLEDIIL